MSEIASASSDSSATTSKSSLRYMPGLDIVRGLAITMVLLYHGASGHAGLFYNASTPGIWLQEFLDLGAFGVQLFFILSGFLITGILVDSRDTPDYYRNFYLRRVLRIVPAYVAILLVLAFTHYISVKYLIVALLYFANMTGIFGVNAEYGPLWSLSVEEQFYLVWPFIVRKLSIRSLAILSVGLLIATPLLRFVLLSGPAALHDAYYKTWAVLDFFAAGACLAMAIRTPAFRSRLSRAVIALFAAGAFVEILQLALPYPSTTLLRNAAAATHLEPELLLFTGLILLAYLYPRSASMSIAKPFLFLANISYGLYLYHMFVFNLVAKHWPKAITASLPPATSALLQFVVEASLSILIATISRNTLEAYFLRRKPKHRLV